MGENQTWGPRAHTHSVSVMTLVGTLSRWVMSSINSFPFSRLRGLWGEQRGVASPCGTNSSVLQGLRPPEPPPGLGTLAATPLCSCYCDWLSGQQAQAVSSPMTTHLDFPVRRQTIQCKGDG